MCVCVYMCIYICGNVITSNYKIYYLKFERKCNLGLKQVWTTLVGLHFLYIFDSVVSECLACFILFSCD